ncbi:hypothetical protein BBD42_14120 [Paenibacillus sp. BIHB 4019]|uniref:Bleomycin resistance protein n=1 Tax=Paenibacillus sp. BIHB 4019 TaxID=1870819 RepID=A0A1B2DID3_9BACL|nr:glyoxalase superfamily protein [Paenibacillus sp. BIHB 4019]ANY67482.1 hypothetical protein BBD42_14120 [Paenibacillus sp. BIHB 4019]
MGQNGLLMKPVVPILRIFDEAHAKAFYMDFLGFRLDWEHRYEANFPLYMQVSNGCCVLHLSEHHGDSCPGAAIRIETSQIEAYHTRLLEKEYRYAKPGLERTPWHTLECSVTDPFGNRLLFYENQLK